MLEPLREGIFDKIYNLNITNINAALVSQVKSREILGFVPSRESEGFSFSPAMRILFNQGHNRKTARVHLADLFRNLAPKSSTGKPPFFKIPESGLLYAEKVKEILELRDTHRIVAIHPGAGADIRKWGAEKFAQVIEPLGRDAGCGFILVGNEKSESEKILNSLQDRNNVLDLTGKTNLDELAGVLSAADLLIGTDSGPLQLAAAVGTGCLGLYFASALMHETGPQGEGHIIVQAEPECSPCLEDDPVCDDYFCRDLITPELTAKIAASILSGEISDLKNDLPTNVSIYLSEMDASGQLYRNLSAKDDDPAAFYRNLWFGLLNNGHEESLPHISEPDITLAEMEIGRWAENPLTYSLVQHYAMIAESEGRTSAVLEFQRMKRILDHS